jgi:hypothetical protein
LAAISKLLAHLFNNSPAKDGGGRAAIHGRYGMSLALPLGPMS